MATIKSVKIEWIKEYHHLHIYLGLKKSDVIAGILKKYMYNPKTYEEKKQTLLKLIDKNKSIFEKYKNKGYLTASLEKEFILK